MLFGSGGFHEEQARNAQRRKAEAKREKQMDQEREAYSEWVKSPEYAAEAARIKTVNEQLTFETARAEYFKLKDQHDKLLATKQVLNTAELKKMQEKAAVLERDVAELRAKASQAYNGQSFLRKFTRLPNQEVVIVSEQLRMAEEALAVVKNRIEQDTTARNPGVNEVESMRVQELKKQMRELRSRHGKQLLHND